MSKFLCHCGHVISDIRYPSATEGLLSCQQDEDRSKAFESVGAFVRALLSGRRDQWIEEFFNKEYPKDLSNESVISDVIAVEERPFHKRVAECESCGRFWVQQLAGQDSYRSYFPDEGGYAAILRGTPESK